MDWLHDIAEQVGREGPVARVVIVAASGPTPRAAGTCMLVWPSRVLGRIGRGALERHAIAVARELLTKLDRAGADARWPRQLLDFETGPVLGEATGGRVSLLVEAFGPAEVAALSRLRSEAGDALLVWRPSCEGAPPVLEARAAGPADIAMACRRFDGEPGLLIARAGADIVIERLAPRRVPFHVYGTGLVARALVRQLAELPFEVCWVDAEPAHFPAHIPVSVRTMATADPAAVALAAAPGGFHAVMTASHDLDLEVCRAIARAGGFGYLGVIGSHLKRERLLVRLTLDGVANDTLERISCPIGLGQIRSKQPAVIAVSIAAEALILLQGDQAGTKR